VTGRGRGRPVYAARDLLRLGELCDAPLDCPEAIGRVIDNIGYRHDWRTDYKVRSVRASLHASTITCIDAAILAYGLLELLFEDVERRLLAIQRRDGNGEECGHCVALYFLEDGRFGAFGKSNYPGLGHRAPRRGNARDAALSYAEAYLALDFQPLYYGVTTLEAVAGDLDWRFSDGPLNEVAARLQGSYEYGFMLAR
jgi:hypothetical protein